MPQLHSLIVSSDFVYWKLLCASSRARDTHRNGHQAEDTMITFAAKDKAIQSQRFLMDRHLFQQLF